VTRLLYVQASPREAESESIQLAETYLSALRERNPDLDVDTIALWDAFLPAFDHDKVAAKTKVVVGEEFDDVQRQAWDEVKAIAERFIAADRYLFAVPMWNGGIPYRLKHYIDIVHQPGLTWTLDPQRGYIGLLTGKHATLALTSGVYSQGVAKEFGVDHHSTYLHDWLREAGVSEIDDIRFQPTLLTVDPAGGREKAQARAVELAHLHGRVTA
jgi:FMN-dependent NADH-azoreductase